MKLTTKKERSLLLIVWVSLRSAYSKVSEIAVETGIVTGIVLPAFHYPGLRIGHNREDWLRWSGESRS